MRIGSIPYPFRSSKRVGLLHEVVAPEELDGRITRLLNPLKSAAPGARAIAKKAAGDIAGRPIDKTLMSEIAELIADLRAGPEAHEGLSAFLEKRKASGIELTAAICVIIGRPS